MTLPALAVGAVGVVSVASNLVPRDVVALVQTFLEGRAAEAEKLHRRLYPLMRDLFIEANPVPVKYALSKAGWMTPEVRLPLVALQESSRVKLDGTLKRFGL